jgi:hypothetical protein
MGKTAQLYTQLLRLLPNRGNASVMIGGFVVSRGIL